MFLCNIYYTEITLNISHSVVKYLARRYSKRSTDRGKEATDMVNCSKESTDISTGPNNKAAGVYKSKRSTGEGWLPVQE